jgi:hypothetical protein
MTKGEVAKLLVVLAASYPKFEVDDVKVQVWHEMLGDLDYAVASMAVKKIIMQNTFPPAIAEVRKAAIEISSPRGLTAAEAWGEVIRAIRDYGYYREKEAMTSMSPITAQVVRYLGWREICLSEEPEILRAHFLKMYDQVAAREQEKQLLSPTMQTEIKKLAKKYDIRLIEGGNAG